jgi:hypothetical protein
MKRLFFLAIAVATTYTVMAQQKADDLVKLNTEKYDFGKIKQGSPVTTYFTLTNVSDKPVVIENAWAGCGCTTPEVSKEPVAPKGTTKVKVGYNAANAAPFTKEVYLKLAGVQEPKIIRITGQVLDAKAYDAYTQTDEYKKGEKEKLDQEAKDAKASQKSAKKAGKTTK